MNEPLRRLLELDLGKGPLLVLTHDNPDPDSIASAAELGLLLTQRRGVDATVGYSGIIGRAENRAMVETLQLPVRHIAELDLAGYQHFALIDAQPNTGNSVVDTINLMTHSGPHRAVTPRRCAAHPPQDM